jgi:hypothetical protein
MSAQYAHARALTALFKITRTLIFLTMRISLEGDSPISSARNKLINTSSPTEKIAELIVNEFDYYTHCVRPEPIIETVYQQPAQVFQIPFEGTSSQIPL